MGNNLKFNSSVCTTREQSQRLLELGLKPETADMRYSRSYYNSDGEPIFIIQILENLPKAYRLTEGCIPAWSLHRLLLLCDVTAMFTRDILETAYDDQINAIENLIKNGYFNKEYLKQ